MSEFNVQYTVGDIIFRSEDNNFTIFKAKKAIFEDSKTEKDIDTLIIKGTFDRIEKGDSFKSTCTWVLDKNYGWQLQSLMYMVVIPSNVNGIRRFLKKFIKGIGKTTADKIVKAYGVKTLDMIRGGVGNLTAIEGIGKKKAKIIYEQILKHDSLEKLSVYLFQHGISNYNDVVHIYECHGEDSLNRISQNPYCICDNLSISKLHIADKIALNSGYSPDSNIRVEKLVLYYLFSYSYLSGNMYITYSDLYSGLIPFILKNNFKGFNLTKNLLDDVLDNLVTLNKIMLVEDNGNTLVYYRSLAEIEMKSAELIKSFLNQPKRIIEQDFYNKFFSYYTAKSGMISEKKQELGVINALEYKLSILTGGPGTGKTQTINEIIDALEYYNDKINIILCAPTGRAAKRMCELTGRTAYTIHRMLGLQGDDDYFGEDSIVNIEADYIICDESSMIDSPLFYKLLLATSKCNASLILVGDKDQLPPVGAGLPFKDLVESSVVPIVKLTELFRQAKESQININALRVLDGVESIGKGGIECDLHKQDFFFFETTNPSFINSLILKCIDSLSVVGLSIDDIMILSSMKKTIIGVEFINKLIQEHVNPANNSKSELKTSCYTLREGDRIMQTVNNYDLGVFNGDIGKIIRIDHDEEEVTVLYDDYEFINDTVKNVKKEIVYSFSLASDLELAYSMTVHKAQGCEFPCVIMPFNQLLVNLSKNIIYTSITRAKKRFICIGDHNTFFSAIKKVDNMHRNTRLKSLIVNQNIFFQAS